MKKDYYSVLGISKDATQAEIKSAYRKLALKFHPDKNPGDAFFEQMFRDVKEAFDVLSNYDKKNRYDYDMDSKQEEYSSKKSSHQPEQPSSADMVNTIISNLNRLVSQTKGVSTHQIKLDVISDYLDRILSTDALGLYQTVSIDLVRTLIFSAIPLLRFFTPIERDKYATLLVLMARLDNELIEEIDQSIKSVSSTQRWKDALTLLKQNSRFVWIAIVIVIIIFVYNEDDASRTTYAPAPKTIAPARKTIVDDEPETKLLPNNNYIFKIKKPSKWKGNQLKTGESPYNGYFGVGIYNKEYENRVRIHNGQKTDVIVCLSQYYSPFRTIRNEYIQAGETFEMTSIPNGTYYLKAFYGNDWNPDTLLAGKIRGFFESDAGFTKSDNYDDLLQIKQDEYKYSTFEITLYPVIGGNMQSEPIDADEFFNPNRH